MQTFLPKALFALLKLARLFFIVKKIVIFKELFDGIDWFKCSSE